MWPSHCGTKQTGRAQGAGDRDRFKVLPEIIRMDRAVMDVLAPVDLKPVGLNEVDRSFKTSGVYFLYRFGEIVYVGQSSDVLRRVGEHMADRHKEFDEVAFVPCQPLNRLWMESQYISRIRPEYNMMPAPKRERRHSMAIRRRV